MKYHQSARIPARNDVTHLPGNIVEARNVSIQVDSLLMLIDKNISSNVVNYANTYIAKISENFHRDRDTKGTTVIEIVVIELVQIVLPEIRQIILHQ